MNDADRELESLLGPLRDGPVALSGVGAAGAQRERLLPGVRTEVERVPARRRRARIVRRSQIAAGGFLAFGALALSVALLERSDNAATPRDGGATMASGEDALRIEPGSAAMAWIDDAGGVRREIKGALTLETPGELVGARDAWSHVSTARGVQLDLAPRARLRVVAAPAVTESDGAPSLGAPALRGGAPSLGAPALRGGAPSGLRLLQGEVHCRVPKLGRSKQFSIATPDAQVIVHGTVFSVAIDDADQSTCVRVDEGLVEVRRAGNSTFVGPNMQWGCERVAAAPTTATTTTTITPTTTATAKPAAAPARRSVAPARRLQHSRVAAAAADGTLDEENRLLESALAAEREGDRRQARKLFAQLLTRHPNSPLIPEARLGLARAR